MRGRTDRGSPWGGGRKQPRAPREHGGQQQRRGAAQRGRGGSRRARTETEAPRRSGQGRRLADPERAGALSPRSRCCCPPCVSRQKTPPLRATPMCQRGYSPAAAAKGRGRTFFGGLYPENGRALRHGGARAAARRETQSRGPKGPMDTQAKLTMARHPTRAFGDWSSGAAQNRPAATAAGASFGSLLQAPQLFSRCMIARGHCREDLQAVAERNPRSDRSPPRLSRGVRGEGTRGDFPPTGVVVGVREVSSKSCILRNAAFTSLPPLGLLSFTPDH